MTPDGGLKQRYYPYRRTRISHFLIINDSELNIEQIQKVSSNTRSDDTKSLKGAILNWITPRGQPLNPSLARNVKIDRGFHHDRTGALLCPADMDWTSTE